MDAKILAKKILMVFEKKHDKQILKQALKKRNAEYIYQDYDKELDYEDSKRG